MAPKPVSKILIQKICQTNEEATEDREQNSKLHSAEFAKALVESIRLINDEPNLIDDHAEDLISNQVLKSINVYFKNQISSYYVNKQTGNPIGNFKSIKVLAYMFKKAKKKLNQ